MDTMPVLLLLMLLSFTVEAQFSTEKIPNITDISAMCSSEGITASIDFSESFSGKIYSMDYATIPDCVYYNSLDSRNILFSIPAHRCGTRLTRTSRNIVDQMENRVYVQMDKDMQSAADRQFNFICQLADGRTSKTVRRHPVRDTYAIAAASDPSALGEPIKPNEVRVAASSDVSFGNWPIPGSRPWNPSMKPAAVFPKQPVATVVHYSSSTIPPTSGMQPILPTLQKSNDPIRANTQDNYMSVPTAYRQQIPQNSVVDPIQATIRRAPPITPAKNLNYELYARGPQSNYINPTFMKNPAVPSIQQPSMPHSQMGTDGYAQPQSPINPDIHMKQGIGMGTVMGSQRATPVNAKTWNQFQTGATLNAPSVDASQSYVSSTAEPRPTSFIEEPKRVGVEFTKDVDENSVTVNEDSNPQVHLVSTQEHLAPRADVLLEIQDGDGPFGKTISKPVRIGENITLVVKALSQMKDPNAYDMFVHSCFATDGPGATKIDLVDRNGCVIRKEFVSPLNRVKNGQQMLYFFRISAFKFPGPDDVYFSCSIELTPLRPAPEICTASRRVKRDVAKDIRLFDIVKVELAEEYAKDKLVDQDATMYCTTPVVIIFVSLVFFALLIAFAISTAIAMILNLKLKAIQSKL